MQGHTSLAVQHDLCLHGLSGMNKGSSHEENETFRISSRLQFTEALKHMFRIILI